MVYVDQKTKLGENEMEPNMENSTHAYREISLVL